MLEFEIQLAIVEEILVFAIRVLFESKPERCQPPATALIKRATTDRSVCLVQKQTVRSQKFLVVHDDEDERHVPNILDREICRVYVPKNRDEIRNINESTNLKDIRLLRILYLKVFKRWRLNILDKHRSYPFRRTILNFSKLLEHFSFASNPLNYDGVDTVHRRLIINASAGTSRRNDFTTDRPLEKRPFTEQTCRT